MRHRHVQCPSHTLCRRTLSPSSCRDLCQQQRVTSGSADCTCHCVWCCRQGDKHMRRSHSHHIIVCQQLMCAEQHLRRESLKVSRLVGYDHPMELPLQRSSIFFPGVRLVLWPRRTKRPLSKTWVNRDWPFPPPSFILGCLSLTRLPPGLMRFSPASFLRFTCWQAPG